MPGSRRIVVCAPTGRGVAPDEARLAGVLVLLRRWTNEPIVIVSDNPARTRAEHLDADLGVESDLVAALADARLVCIAGRLCRAEDFERAARDIALARIAAVPVALVALDVAPPESPAARTELGEIVASCESMSGVDSASSACLAAARGRSVETVVAPEFVLEPEVRVRRGIAIDESYWQTSGEAARRALVSALDHVGFAPALVAGSGSTAAPQRAWQNLRSRLESLVALVTADSALASASLACGAMPVVVVGSGGESLHRRAGFDACLVTAPENAEAWVRAFTAALRTDAGDLARRIAPLRSLAWRALGPLAEATRPREWDPSSWSARTRAIAAAACARLVAPALAAGDAPRAEAVLDRFGHALGHEPAWACARAQAFALSGRDPAAVELLERVRTQHPDDVETLAALARARMRQGDLHGAIAMWDDVARRAVTAPEPWYESGTLALLAGASDDALRRFAAALDRDPAHGATLRAVHAWFGGRTEAEADFLRAARAASGALAAVAAAPSRGL